MPTTQEISSYVTGLSSATLAGTEEVYLATDEKTTVQDIADLNGNLITTIVNIGDWDMTVTYWKLVAHGIADFTKIRAVSAVIINDAGDKMYNLAGIGEGTDALTGGIQNIQSTVITVQKTIGGFFDSVDFDSVGYNRGYLTIDHIP